MSERETDTIDVFLRGKEEGVGGGEIQQGRCEWKENQFACKIIFSRVAVMRAKGGLGNPNLTFQFTKNFSISLTLSRFACIFALF